MKIGVTTYVLNQRKWFKQLDQLPSKTIEIGARAARVYFDPVWVDKVGKMIQGYDLSFHSGTTKIFSSEEQFTKAEIERIKAEIIVCKRWNINELIFHLKHEKLENHEIRTFQEIVNYAKKNRVQLIYESNGCLIAEVALDLLKKFPDIKFNLDLGHLNVGIENNKFGYDLDKFLEEIDKRTVYIHAHNNLGKDKHQSLINGTLDWKYILNKLNHIQKIITETRTLEDINSDIESLRQFLK